MEVNNRYLYNENVLKSAISRHAQVSKLPWVLWLDEIVPLNPEELYSPIYGLAITHKKRLHLLAWPKRKGGDILILLEIRVRAYINVYSLSSCPVFIPLRSQRNFWRNSCFALSIVGFDLFDGKDCATMRARMSLFDG